MAAQLGVTIASEIAARDGVDPATLEPPLYEVVDVDALEQLIQPDTHERTSFEGEVSFEYQDYTVTVDHTGEVTITPQDVANAGVSRTKNAIGRP